MCDFDDENSEDQKPKRKPRPPKPVTQARVREQALRYLDRFGTTTEKLKRHLLTKNYKAIQFHGHDPEQIHQFIETEVDKLEKSGVLNDQQYADSKARSLSRQGKSTRHIRGKLGTLGLKATVTDNALTDLSEVEGYTDRIGAAKYIRKRRFGPFKPLETREARRDKELSSLVRNGYAFDLASELLSKETTEEIDDIIYGQE
jgi:regulatory protein